MIRLLDRAVLRELLFPFLMAVAGFVLFILLNLILQLSDFVIDRDVAWSDLLRALVYKMPDLIVIGLPIAVLFATFLALGRLKHDRELIALQASGISLRRVIAPVIAFGLLVGLATFALNETTVPWANQQYRALLTQMISRGSVPQIRDNTFFKDAQGRFFYVRRYDPSDGLLQDVLVFDPTGTTYLPGARSPFPQLISAERAGWDGDTWRLEAGIAHQLDESGALSYQARFESLAIRVGDAIETLFVEQRTPREMSLRELAERIDTFQQSGYRASELWVEFQSKLAVPLGALVFALFAAPLSLSFGFRGRAAGVVISVVLTGTYQGFLFWAETLARRELLSPVWGPWLPNLAFGVLGLVLAWNVDRASRVEWGRLFRRAGGLLLALGLGGSAWAAQPAPEVPLDVRAQALEISRDGSELRAQGEVVAVYGNQTVRARELVLRRESEDRWRFEVVGEVAFSGDPVRVTAERAEALLERGEGGLRPLWIILDAFEAESDGERALRYRARRGELRFRPGAPLDAADPLAALERVELAGEAELALGGETTLAADALTLSRGADTPWRADARGHVRFADPERQTRAEALALAFELEGGRVRLREAEVEAFEGQSAFDNARGESHTLRFKGARGRFLFEGDALSRLELEGATVTTCLCSEEVERASYALSARQVTLWPDEWVLGRELAFSAAGWPLFWTPLFLAPLKDLQENPLLPEFGRDAARGWFARWRLPAFEDERNHGAFLLDYYHRYRETGLGLDWRYGAGAGQSGQMRLYHLVGRHEVLELDWSHRWTLGELAELSGSLRRRDVRPEGSAPSQWAYGLDASGSLWGWSWRAGAAREETSQEAEEDEDAPRYRVLERLPELSLSRGGAIASTPLRYGGSASWGRYREQRGESGPFVQTDRVDLSGRLGLDAFELAGPQLRANADGNARLSRYGEGMQRTSAQFQSGLTWSPVDGLSASTGYLYRAVRGRSPFAFDELELADRWNGQLRFAAAGFNGNLSTGFSPTNGRFEPVALQLSARLGEHALNARLSTVAHGLELDALTVQEVWTPDWGRLSLQGGYQVKAGRFDDLIAKVELANWVRLGARVDLNRPALLRTNLEGSWHLGRWELDLRGEYDWRAGRVTAMQAGLVRHLCDDCWQVGLYSSGTRIWLQVQINAFPEAGLSYSPSDGELGFGN